MTATGEQPEHSEQRQGTDGAAPGAPAGRHATLVATAFNEAGRIERCLDRMAGERLPATLAWREFVVLAGASTDGTDELARAWGERNPAIPVRVETTAERLGKSADLASCHAALLARLPPDELVCLTDADVLPMAGSPAAVLAALARDPALAVAWGVDVPDNREIGRRAAAFQLEVSTEVARLNRGLPRAYGRLLAYRLGSLAGFTWKTGYVVDDTQMSWYVAEQGLKVTTETSARVLTTPPKGYRDLYLQTYRAFRAHEVKPGELPPPQPRGRLTRQLEAIARAAAKDPIGAGAYAVARAVMAGLHRRSSHVFDDDWSRPSSTKQASAPGP